MFVPVQCEVIGMLDFTQGAAAKLDFDLEPSAFEAAPEFRNLQSTYRAHRCARSVTVAPRVADDSLFARPGSRMANGVLDLAPENIFA